MKTTYYYIFLTFLFGISSLYGQTCVVPQSERDALIDLYNATNGANWTNNTNWNTSADLCDWFGVTTQIDRGVVLKSTDKGYISYNSNITPQPTDSFSGKVKFSIDSVSPSSNCVILSRWTGSNGFILQYRDYPSSPVVQFALGGVNVFFEAVVNAPINFNEKIEVSWEFSGEALNSLIFNGQELVISPLTFSNNLIDYSSSDFTLKGISSLYSNIYANASSGNQDVRADMTFYSVEFTLNGSVYKWNIENGIGNILNSSGIGANANVNNIDSWIESHNVSQLDLHGNQLSGTIPTQIGDLTNLNTLRLYTNQLTGNIPSELWTLSLLTNLQLQQNQLTGSIPTSIDNLTNITYLGLSSNLLSGSIPVEIGNLTNLTHLFLYGNQLTGSIPVEILSLSNLEVLNLNTNQLTGNIPANLDLLTNLKTLALSGNLLSGFIPPEIGYLSNLTSLNLSDNQLSGSIPSSLGSLSSLAVLSCGENNLVGSIPVELGNLSNLVTLYVQSNQLTGSIPSGLSSIATLENFYFENNAFIFSNFESEHLTYQTNLNYYTYSPQAKVDQEETVSLTEGDSYTFTTSLSSTNNSYQWYKDGVAISGATSKDYTINSLSASDAGIYYLKATNSIVAGLTLQRNDITLNVAADTCGVPQSERDALLALYNATNGPNWTNTLANNQPWDINIPVCDWYGILVQNGHVASVNLNNNNLAGVIPEEFASLPTLVFVTLDNNELTGSIPDEFAGLNYLLSLQLNHNQLSGTISSGLINSPSLQFLEINNNNLSGALPDFTNLTSLDNLGFSNNAFIFSDFEGEHITYTSYTTYNYTPQAKVDQEETVILAEGESYTLTTALISTNNHYQWQHSIDGGITWTNVGTDANTYTITSASSADAGMYRFLATNGTVDGLTLTRNTVFVNVTETGLSNVCLSGSSIISSARSSEAYTDLTIRMLDNSNISHLNATITKGYWNNEEFTLNKVFDSLGHISFSCTDKASNCNGGQFFDQFEIEYSIESSSGTYQGIQMFFADSIIDGRLYDGGVTANFECFYTPDNDNTFCLSDYEDEIIMANLFPRGDNILWYATETGGTPYNNDYDFIDDVFDLGGTITYWWDDTTDSISTRTAAQIIIYDLPEGDEEQSFSAYTPTAPTIEDIEVENGDDQIYWYDSSTGGTLLSSSTTLVDGQTYYASSCDVGNTDCGDCRLPVTISIGVIPPNGKPIQYLCEQSTLSDIVLDVENGLSTVWYDREAGGNILGGTTPIINGTTYYAAQKDTAIEDESDERLAVLVYLLTSPEPRVTETIQTFYTAYSPTVNDLRAFGYTVNWYSQPSGGTLYDVNTPLEDGVTYYAEQESRAMCPSINRVGVTVILSEEPADPLVGCELFRPELLGHYVINAWVNERDVDSEIIDQVPFKDSEESELFVELLNHLKNRFLSEDKSLHDFPPVYEPEFTGGEQQIDFAPLMNYINGLSTSEKKLIVYDFQPIYDDYYATGLGRAIGFSFYLNSAKSSQFRYLTPTFTYNVPVVSRTSVIQTPVTEHYPLMNNEGNTSNEFLNFTNVEVNEDTGVFTIYSSFNQITEPLYNQSAPTFSQTNIEGTDSDPYVMKHTSIRYEYTEAAYQASPTYDKAKIEVSFVDVDNKVIGTPVELQPHGPIIDKWQQVSADFIIPSNAGRMKITIKNTDDNRFAYFDDIRIHPFDSNMKTFVYHPETQRLMSELDENNYATFYEYDLEGGLVRVKKETEKGIYTIQETRSGNVKATN